MRQSTRRPPRHEGRNVAKVRALRGYSQTDLGKMLKVSKQAISFVEQRDRLTKKKLNDFARVLDVSAEGLKYFTDEMVFQSNSGAYATRSMPSMWVGGNMGTILTESPLGKMMKFWEMLLEAQRKIIEDLKRRKKITTTTRIIY